MMFDVINTCATCAMLCWASVIRHIGLVRCAMLGWCAAPSWASVLRHVGQVCYAMLDYATSTAASVYALQRTSRDVR